MHENGAGEYGDGVAVFATARPEDDGNSQAPGRSGCDGESSDYEIVFRAGTDSKMNNHLSLGIELTNEYDSMPDEEGFIEKKMIWKQPPDFGIVFN
ncbi:MAG: hypothetical protein MUC65_01340 [Pontiellaceae bacterium]|nr:hypothetical protein [Pontiellaceae bacterium]